jgi:hypothetical protein
MGGLEPVLESGRIRRTVSNAAESITSRASFRSRNIRFWNARFWNAVAVSPRVPLAGYALLLADHLLIVTPVIFYLSANAAMLKL